MLNGKLDLSGLMKQKGDAGAKASVSPSVQVDTSKVKVNQVTQRPSGKIKDIKELQKSKYYFYSVKPNLSFHVSPKLRIRFEGNYYETGDDIVAEYIIKHYSRYVSLITEEQKTDGISIKEGQLRV